MGRHTRTSVKAYLISKRVSLEEEKPFGHTQVQSALFDESDAVCRLERRPTPRSKATVGEATMGNGQPNPDQAGDRPINSGPSKKKKQKGLAHKQAKVMAKRLAQSKADKAKQAAKQPNKPAMHKLHLDLEAVLASQDANIGEGGDQNFTITSARSHTTNTSRQPGDVSARSAELSEMQEAAGAPAQLDTAAFGGAELVAGVPQSQATALQQSSIPTQELVSARLAALEAGKPSAIVRWMSLARELTFVRSLNAGLAPGVTPVQDIDDCALAIQPEACFDVKRARHSHALRAVPARIHPLQQHDAPTQLRTEADERQGKDAGQLGAGIRPQCKTVVEFQLGLYGHITLMQSPSEQRRADIQAALLAQLLSDEESQVDEPRPTHMSMQPHQLPLHLTASRPPCRPPKKLTLLCCEGRAPCLVVDSSASSPASTPASLPASLMTATPATSSAAASDLCGLSGCSSSCPSRQQATKASSLPRVGAPSVVPRSFSLCKAVKAFFGLPSAASSPAQPDAKLSEAARWLAEAHATN